MVCGIGSKASYGRKFHERYHRITFSFILPRHSSHFPSYLSSSSPSPSRVILASNAFSTNITSPIVDTLFLLSPSVNFLHPQAQGQHKDNAYRKRATGSNQSRQIFRSIGRSKPCTRENSGQVSESRANTRHSSTLILSAASSMYNEYILKRYLRQPWSGSLSFRGLT